MRLGEKKETIWWDTIGAVQRLDSNAGRIQVGKRDALPTAARSDAAIQAGRTCLARFNPDTATFQDATDPTGIFEVLLMAHRDEDARRFADRFLDSMRAKSETDYKDQMQWILENYLWARPKRYEDAKRMHTRILAVVANDSGYRAIRADMQLSIAAWLMGDTTYSNELAWHAIRTSDAMPLEERLQSYDSRLWMGWLAGRVEHFTEAEGFDSLAISTLAYNMYLANTVNRRVYGGELATATDARVQPYKVPDLVGEHYYTSTAGASSGPSGQAPYTTHGAVPPGTLPVKGRINYITSWPSFCHSEGGMRWAEKRNLGYSGSSCAQKYNVMRMYKEMYPDIEIIVLSNTYGTVGQLGPLTPTEEADTLAKLFLGRGRVPAHLVVEQTPFFHADAPDGRRIDLPTPQMDLLGNPRERYDNPGGIFLLTDKEGYRVKMRGPDLPGEGYPKLEYWKRFITILKNRPSK